MGEAEVLETDARTGLADALAGCDVLVNAASYRVNLEAMNASLQAGCHYIDFGGGIVSTGAPAAAVVRLMARGRIDAMGVLPPESCVDPDDLFPELENRGVTFEVQAREGARA